MNTIYLMRDRKFDFCLFKVGFATDMAKRITQYTTHNPLVECVSTVKTQVASGRDIEKVFHDEVKAMGYEFITATIDGKKTEWFKVPYTDSFYEKLSTQGLNAFKCGRKRKNYGEYHTDKGRGESPSAPHNTTKRQESVNTMLKVYMVRVDVDGCVCNIYVDATSARDAHRIIRKEGLRVIGVEG